MRIMITGSSGRLGRYLTQHFPDSSKPTHGELDIIQKDAVLEFLSRDKPDAVIHMAAWVDVRGCESDKEKAWNTNVVGTENVVNSAFTANSNCYFVFLSTACVFFGDRGSYTENDIPHPKNFYGLTKLVAEQIIRRMPTHLIVRTDFVDRTKWPYEGAFVDRFSTSVFADTLARALKQVITARVTGLIHLTGKRRISHYELARITTPDVKPIRLADVDLPLPCDQSLRSIKGWDTLEMEY